MMSIRRWFQSVSLFVLSLGNWFQVKWLCIPIFHCHSCPLSIVSCPVGVLGHYLSLGVFPFVLLGTILLFGALLGRALCGWVCPFGLLQELLYKIPSPKFKPWAPLRYGKYIVLVTMVIAVPFFWGIESAFYFCRICPAATIESSIPHAIQQGGFSSFWPTVIRMSILAAVVLLMIFSLRFFCRTLCPVGAITALMNPISAFALRHDTDGCPQCGECSDQCPMDIDLTEEPRGVVYKAHTECILCLECEKACPIGGGLKGTFAGFPKQSAESKKCSPLSNNIKNI